MRRFAETMTWAEDGGFAIDAAVDERLGFIRRTYLHLLALLAGVAGVTTAVVLSGFQLSLPVALVGFLAILFVVPRLLVPGVSAGRQYLAAGLCVAFYGILLAPLVMYAQAVTGSLAVLGNAAVITACVFVGLTAYVFTTKKDFSFLRGMLHVALWAIIGIGIVSIFLGGFSTGTQTIFSVVVIGVFAGFVLYDTSNILHHYPVNAHVVASVMLMIDVVVLFKHIAILLINSRE